MARPLEQVLVITDWDQRQACPFDGSNECDPDDMDRWARHLSAWHGYKVVEDRPRPFDDKQPRTIRLELVGWSDRAKFRPNQRVDVKADARPRDYAGRRGTVVGWSPETSEYAVTFDGPPLYGVLPASSLEAFEKQLK